MKQRLPRDIRRPAAAPLAAAAGLATAALFGLDARAASQYDWIVNGESWDPVELGDVTEQEDGGILIEGFTPVIGTGYAISEWMLEFDENPEAGGSFLFRNTTETTEFFSIFLGAPTLGSAPSSIEEGFIEVTLIDASGDDSVTLTSLSWRGIVDGVTELSLFDNDAVVCGTGLNPGCPRTVSASFGPSAGGPGFSGFVGIQLDFALSAQDAVSVRTTYDLTAVPGPAGLPLLLSALAFCGAMRLRRGDHRS